MKDVFDQIKIADLRFSLVVHYINGDRVIEENNSFEHLRSLLSDLDYKHESMQYREHYEIRIAGFGSKRADVRVINVVWVTGKILDGSVKRALQFRTTPLDMRKTSILQDRLVNLRHELLSISSEFALLEECMIGHDKAIDTYPDLKRFSSDFDDASDKLTAAVSRVDDVVEWFGENIHFFDGRSH